MLDGIHKIHLIGIGGSGMRAIANILIQKGYDVSGSDVAESAVISKFREMGAKVHIGHNKEYVNGVDAVVRSTAIREDNPEIVAAKEQGITILHRSDIVKAVLDVDVYKRQVCAALTDAHSPSALPLRTSAISWPSRRPGPPSLNTCATCTTMWMLPSMCSCLFSIARLTRCSTQKVLRSHRREMILTTSAPSIPPSCKSRCV